MIYAALCLTHRYLQCSMDSPMICSAAIGLLFAVAAVAMLFNAGAFLMLPKYDRRAYIYDQTGERCGSAGRQLLPQLSNGMAFGFCSKANQWIPLHRYASVILVSRLGSFSVGGQQLESVYGFDLALYL